MRAHFFDIDTLIKSDAKVCVVDKGKPSLILMRIPVSDFNLIRNGVYRAQGNRIAFAGTDYFLPDEVMNGLKIACKKARVDVSNLAFSMREFMDPELIGMSNHSVDLDAFRHLTNTQDDVYILCSRNTKKAYGTVIDRLEEKMAELGVKPKRYYFVSETFYHRDEDAVIFDKVRLVLQHLVGLRTDGRRFTDEVVEAYDSVHLYDDDRETTEMALGASDVLAVLAGNSEESVRDMIRDSVGAGRVLEVSLVTTNRVRKFETARVSIEYGKLIRSFESFRFLG